MKIICELHMYPEAHRAGSEVTAHAILRGLVKRGHECKVISVENTDEYYVLDGVEVFRPPVVEPQRNEFFMEKYRWADLAVTHLNCTGHAMYCARETSKPLVHLIHNTNQIKFHNIRPIRAQLLIFNSEWVRDTTPMNPSIVVHPIVDPNDYRVERPEAEAVTFINLTVTKGALVFYELARRLMDTPFIGVKGAYGEQHLIADNLENLTIHEQMPDLRPIYAQTKVVLMPSDYESYGRVAVEAACSGIPAIVHPTPGLKEALGPAGIYIDRANVDAWETELRRLLNDEVYYAERSQAAQELAKSLKPEVALDVIESALTIVNRHGLKNSGATYEALGKELYQNHAVQHGHFDPRREPAGYRPSLGGVMTKGSPFTTDRQVYLDSHGNPVDSSSRDKQILVLGANATISYEQALSMGLIDAAGTPFYETQAFVEPTETQAFESLTSNRDDRLIDVEPLMTPQAVKVPRQRRQRASA